MAGADIHTTTTRGLVCRRQSCLDSTSLNFCFGELRDRERKRGGGSKARRGQMGRVRGECIAAMRVERESKGGKGEWERGIQRRRERREE